MAKIPWYVWIIVGAGIFFMSARIGEKMDVFLYIGMLLIIIGVFKAIASFILGISAKRSIEEAREIRHQQFACPRCRSIIASTYSFCPHCGTRLKY